MLIDTNGFEIGDEVYFGELVGYFNSKYRPNKSYIYGFEIEILHNKLNVCAKIEHYGSYHVSRLYNTEQQAIDYCNHMNGDLC